MEYTKLQSRISTSSSSSSSLPSSPTSFSYIPLHKTQLHPRMHSFSLATPYLKSSSSSSNKFYRKYLFLFISLSFIPFLIYLLSLYRSVHLSSKFTPSNSNIFGAVIDIDDFRTQIRVFHSINQDSELQLIEKDSDFMSVQPGLYGIENDPDEAGRVILELLAFAKKRVPKSEWKNSKIQLFVSGDTDKAGVDMEDKVLKVCRRVLRSSGFLFSDDWASVLKGQDEGIYAWVAVNHALGSLGSEPQETAGAVELGGASLQITFAAREPPPSVLSRILRFGGVTYSLYTQSFPQFGQDATWKSLDQLRINQEQTSFHSERAISNACIPRGYELGSHSSDVKLLKSLAAGNFSTCRSEVLALLRGRQGQCASPPCNVLSLPIELKEIDSGKRFFFTSKLLGFVSGTSLSDLEAAGRQFCEDEWDDLKHKHNDLDDLDMLRYCFSHAFMAALLQENLGVSSNNRVGYSRNGGSKHIDWIMGAFLYQMMAQPLLFEAAAQDQIVMNESITYLLLIAVLLFAVLGTAFFVMKLRKPQYKTIYDLEKGQYIVTRVPR